MNRLAVVLIALSIILTAPNAVAQTYTGNLSLTSQEEVDAFNYSEVTGSLTISGADIVDLSPLSPLTWVGKLQKGQAVMACPSFLSYLNESYLI